MRGLLLLHLFEYPDAAKSFVAAEKADPGFAMAYWGEAMTFNLGVWNEVDLKAGQAALARSEATPEQRAGRIANPRERAYFNAVEILYTGKANKRERDAQYATAMEQLVEGLSQRCRGAAFLFSGACWELARVYAMWPRYLKAAEIAKAVFVRNPQHPGAAHYWIHGMDDPQHAAGALKAARALSTDRARCGPRATYVLAHLHGAWYVGR